MKAVFLILLTATLALAAQPVWIDTDPSVARGGHEVDDGFALVQAFHSSALQVRGISAVFGNAPLDQDFPIARHLVKDFAAQGLPVSSGAASAGDLGIETAASRALADALQREELTILMLGPATNVATVLKNHPGLAKRIVKIIAVAGRRRNQKFSASSSAAPFRDFNFEMDAKSFQVLLDSGVPLALGPWELSSKVWIRESDLKRLRSANPSLRWILNAAQDWLAYWQTNFATDGFNPFDTLAVGYAINPADFGCARLPVRIEQHADDRATRSPVPQKPYLIADKSMTSKASALYCSEPPPSFKQNLFRLLERHD